MMRLLHDRTGAVIATAVTLADTRASRRRGLLGRDSMEEGEAVDAARRAARSTPSSCGFAIDVIFVDGDGCVVHGVADAAVAPCGRLARPNGD